MEEALKLGDDLNQENIPGDDEAISLDELKEMNQTIISESNRLTRKAQSFFKRVSSGESIPKDEQTKLDQEWKQLRKMESAYRFIIQKSKQAGVKVSEIEENASVDLNKIKDKKNSMGAIIRQINDKK